ncbi:MAG: flavin reductase family protein [Paludibacteraceae bacterium]|nr:flavin reductase family protein [Paludibacteraceae bacterium]
MKQSWKPGTMIYPLPAVLVGVGDRRENWNLITIGWVGTICTNPAMCYISVRPERHSYPLIEQTREFTINLTTEQMARETDWCGVKSGRDYDKFNETGLTPMEGEMVKSPTIEQSPLAIECKVVEIKELGSHNMIIAEVVNIRADEKFIDKETGEFRLQDAKLISYSHGHYYKLGEEIGKFGFSVKKK